MYSFTFRAIVFLFLSKTFFDSVEILLGKGSTIIVSSVKTSKIKPTRLISIFFTRFGMTMYLIFFHQLKNTLVFPEAGVPFTKRIKL